MPRPARDHGGDRVRRRAHAARRRKIAIGAPWSKTMDKPMVDFMETSGFEVVHSEVVGSWLRSSSAGRSGTSLRARPPDDRPDADAVIMPGGNWPSMSVVERLERELGKPVLANNAVSLWAGLRLLKTGDSIPGCGSCCVITSPHEFGRMNGDAEHDIAECGWHLLRIIFVLLAPLRRSLWRVPQNHNERSK
jgi:hypothetical protein